MFKNRLGDERHYPGSMAQLCSLPGACGRTSRPWMGDCRPNERLLGAQQPTPGYEDAGAAALLAQGLNVGRDDR